MLPLDVISTVLDYVRSKPLEELHKLCETYINMYGIELSTWCYAAEVQYPTYHNYQTCYHQKNQGVNTSCSIDSVRDTRNETMREVMRSKITYEFHLMKPYKDPV